MTFNKELLDVLRSMGIEPSNTKRIGIVFDCINLPVIFVEQLGDSRKVTEVLNALARGEYVVSQVSNLVTQDDENGKVNGHG